MGKIILVFISMIILAGLVFALGVTYPMPSSQQLYQGETGSFSFQIQTDDSPMTCWVELQDTQGLELIFEPEYNVGANERYRVDAGVHVPEELEAGSYTAKFCAACKPTDGNVITKFCNLPVNVEVLAEEDACDEIKELEGRELGKLISELAKSKSFEILREIVRCLRPIK